MKMLTLVLLMLVSNLSYSQEIDPIEAQLLWDNNITAILEENYELVMDQTIFPLNTFYGELGPDDFLSSIKDIFTNEVIEDIRRQSPNDFQAVINDEGITAYMLVVLTTTVTEDGEFESATILCFRKEINEWKLYHIDAAG